MIAGFITGVTLTILIIVAGLLMYDMHYDTAENKLEAQYRTVIDSNYVNMKQTENVVGATVRERIKDFTPVNDEKRIRPQKIVIHDFDKPDIHNKWEVEYNIISKNTDNIDEDTDEDSDVEEQESEQ